MLKLKKVKGRVPCVVFVNNWFSLCFGISAAELKSPFTNLIQSRIITKFGLSIDQVEPYLNISAMNETKNKVYYWDQ